MKFWLRIVVIFYMVTNVSVANEVNIFSSRHYDSDIELYKKFTEKTGIKVNVISGKDAALQKRITEEGKDSKADLYVTSDAGRLSLFDKKGMFQNSISSVIKLKVPENILIDTSPDLRQQLLRHKIKKIDKVFYSHMHADQTHGINDLRSFFI
ncbi:MBL fold metallo-hydrolase, partial [Pelagibacteraceae bacterium]|nr:MBL fold metallo-hydrolase [Pelagibacteraceae bacterium]